MSITAENRCFIDLNMFQMPVKADNLVFVNVPKPCQCNDYIVTGSNDGKGYKMDYNSAWAKLFSQSDTVDFKLYKDDVLATYQPTPKDFKKDEFSKYCTIDWTAVLNSDGEGCCKLEVTTNIFCDTNTIIWGKYRLSEFDLQMINRTVKLKAVFNQNQFIEGIDFTGSNVVDTLRFGGFFGDRQPVKEIENQIDLKYQSNTIVVRNSNEYTLQTHKIQYDGYLDRIIDLYLLSQSELYISDFNWNNQTNRYLDWAVSTVESEKLDYERGVQKTSLTVKLKDKVMNQITHA